MAINDDKLNAFMGRFVGDMGAVAHAATVVVGDQLGLYKALAEGPTDVQTLARRTETDARYLRNGCPPRRPAATSSTTLPASASA